MDDVLKTMRPNKGLGARLPMPTKNGPNATSVNSALARASGIRNDEDDEFPAIVTEGKECVKGVEGGRLVDWSCNHGR